MYKQISMLEIKTDKGTFSLIVPEGCTLADVQRVLSEMQYVNHSQIKALQSHNAKKEQDQKEESEVKEEPQEEQCH